MTQQSLIRRDRIHIDDSYHATYEDLTTENNGAVQPFKTMKDVFLLAALIGYRSGRRTVLENRRGIFSWAQFTPQEDVPVLQALTIAETGGVEVLRDRDKLLTIVEEYANSGILEIKAQIAETPGNRIGNLVGLLQPWMRLDELTIHGGFK